MERLKQAAEHAEAIMLSEIKTSVNLYLKPQGVEVAVMRRRIVVRKIVGWLSMKAAVVNPIVTAIDAALLEVKS